MSIHQDGGKLTERNSGGLIHGKIWKDEPAQRRKFPYKQGRQPGSSEKCGSLNKLGPLEVALLGGVALLKEV